jgi:hypothetical protein
MSNNTPNLELVKYHLRKPVYKYHQFQGSSNDCGPSSLSIAANAMLGKVRFKAPRVAEEMNDVAFEPRPIPHWVVRRVPDWATFPWGIVHYLRENNISARWSLFGTVEKLQANLQADLITIVIIGQPLLFKKWRPAGWSHAKTLFGHIPAKGFLFVDSAHKPRPDRPGTWAEHGLTWQDEKEFMKQWRSMLRIYIEVGESPAG